MPNSTLTAEVGFTHDLGRETPPPSLQPPDDMCLTAVADPFFNRPGATQQVEEEVFCEFLPQPGRFEKFKWS